MTNAKIKNILVVDDDHVQIKLLDGILKSNGYNVISCDEAANGLQHAMTANPDLIILDVMMPIINGYNFCKLLKDQHEQKHIPIILLTSRTDQDDIKIGMAMGAEAYLCKPINTQELLKTIKVIESHLSQK